MSIPITVNVKVDELLANGGIEKVSKQVQEELSEAFEVARKKLRDEIGSSMLGERISALIKTTDPNNPQPGVHISDEPLVAGGVSYDVEEAEKVSAAFVEVAAEQVGTRIVEDLRKAQEQNRVVEAAGTATLAPPLLQFQRLHALATMPKRAHATDAGFDLTSTEAHKIAPGEYRMVSTGLAVAIPAGYVGLVAPRSGLAAKHGISITNAPGIIDSGYRGEIKCLIHNLGTEHFKIEIGDRIAQLVVTPFLPALSVEVNELPAADRGDAGFGSTGT